MKLFNRKEKRANDGVVSFEDGLLSAILGGSSEVTKKEALQIPTVAACITLIADRISSLPIKLYREDGKLFCMPSDILNGKATETMISQFVQNCLMPPINTIEAALDHDLLTEAEKAGHYYFAFDTSELTRGDFTSRMNGYAVALENNIYQLDEIREKEDLPPLGFNYVKLGLDTVLLDLKTGQIYTPNTDKMTMLNSGNLLTSESKDDIIQERGNPYHDPTNGRFTSGHGGSSSQMVTKDTKVLNE